MSDTQEAPCFEQLHIDVARNATDDFNPFHDKLRWKNIRQNPFAGPIVLGFQLESLIESRIRRYREIQGEPDLIRDLLLGYSHYEFRFAGAVEVGKAIEISIRKSRLSRGDSPVLSNRVSLYAGGRLALTGYKRESRHPTIWPDFDVTLLEDLNGLPDRSTLADGYFLKRKFATTSNAKNFLCGSLVEQSDYIDEISEQVRFPEMFPCALLSCALLECVRERGHDFEQNPMVYGSHQISVNRQVLSKLRSNDRLNLLVRPTESQSGVLSYECHVVLGADQVLASAKIGLLPLASLASDDGGE